MNVYYALWGKNNPMYQQTSIAVSICRHMCMLKYKYIGAESYERLQASKQAQNPSYQI